MKPPEPADDPSLAEPCGNRAVSALFRVFGGEGRPLAGETTVRSPESGLHEPEFRVLAVLVPVTAWVAIATALAPYLGRGWADVAGLPIGFLALNLLPWLAWRKSPEGQWRLTLLAAVLWAVFHRHATGMPGLLAWTWIGIAVMNTAAVAVLMTRTALAWPGAKGIVFRSALALGLHGVAFAIGWHWGWGWALAGGAFLAAVGCWLILQPGGQWLGPVTRTTGGDDILITIDDGPDPVDTPALLDLLDRHQAKAVFFMIGEKVRAHPELARQVIRRGHEIGNHTLTHPQASFWCAGPARTRREIEGCQRAIEEATGVRPRWFRAPVGHRNWFTHPIAAACGLRVMAWNRRGYDAVAKSAAPVLAEILPRLTAGDIVLLHEATPIAAEVLAGVLERSHPPALSPPDDPQSGIRAEPKDAKGAKGSR